MPDRDNLKEYIMKTDALILELGITDIEAELEKDVSKYRFVEAIYFNRYLSTHVFHRKASYGKAIDNPSKLRYRQIAMLESLKGKGWTDYKPTELPRVLSLIDRGLVRINAKNQFRLTGKEW